MKEKQRNLHIYFGLAQKLNIFGPILKYCQVIAKETPLEPDTTLGLRPDSSKHKLQINFCCLNAKYYIWLCRQKKCSPKLNDFLLYLKHIYEMEKNTTTIVLKKWEPLLPLL